MDDFNFLLILFSKFSISKLTCYFVTGNIDDVTVIYFSNGTFVSCDTSVALPLELLPRGPLGNIMCYTLVGLTALCYLETQGEGSSPWNSRSVGLGETSQTGQEKEGS